MPETAPPCLFPDWPAPARVKALVTSRNSPLGTGASSGPYANFNLAAHVGDEPSAIDRNRRSLQEFTGLQQAPQWLQQVHGTKVHYLQAGSSTISPLADAIYCREARLACGILTADCLPVFFCNNRATEVAVAHAGWRGLAAGVLENTLQSFQSPPQDLLAWLGPAIGPCHFEVGADVRQAFLEASVANRHEEILQAFTAAGEGKWMADLYVLARLRLRAAGIQHIHGGGLCTFCEHERFYSFRREKQTGRFASLIWLQ